ncbi:hypothetical protein EVAR_62597_1 [Eumeta japonica]|uniref:Uncharacterized protein n=1 Tax=Eumeta variegata TaxID=151549 RepID=A0A4C1ZKT5_EUMVA|nr:hypothetical protein EVAR_62597_1 [Eumeta japonica]
MDSQHLSILITVEIGARHLPPQITRQHTNWAVFQASLKMMHLGSSFATVVDVDTVANQLVNKIRRAHFMVTNFLLISTSSRGDLPSHIKVKLQQKYKLHKLCCLASLRACTRCLKFKKELNNLREISVAIRHFYSVAWETTLTGMVKARRT